MSPDGLQVAEIEGSGLTIGSGGDAAFLNIDAAGRTDAFGPAKVHHPSGGIQHMDAHVAHDAIAVFHECPPSTWVDGWVVGSHWGRARPHVVVQMARRIRVWRILAIAHVIIAAQFHMGDFAQLAFLNDVARFDEVGSAAALGSDLDDSTVFARRIQHGMALYHVHSGGFLNVDVGSRLRRFDHGEGMPVIRRIDQNDV